MRVPIWYPHTAHQQPTWHAHLGPILAPWTNHEWAPRGANKVAHFARMGPEQLAHLNPWFTQMDPNNPMSTPHWGYRYGTHVLPTSNPLGMPTWARFWPRGQTMKRPHVGPTVQPILPTRGPIGLPTLTHLLPKRAPTGNVGWVFSRLDVVFWCPGWH